MAEAVPEVAEAVEVVPEVVLPETVPQEVDTDKERPFTCLRLPSPHYEDLKFKSTTYERERPAL